MGDPEVAPLDDSQAGGLSCLSEAMLLGIAGARGTKDASVLNALPQFV